MMITFDPITPGLFSVYGGLGGHFYPRLKTLDRDMLEIWNLVQCYFATKAFEKIYQLVLRFPKEISEQKLKISILFIKSYNFW